MKRILAIDLRSTRIGFAVLELPLRLVEWGKRAITAESCSPLVVSLIRRYGISVIVIRRVKAGSRRDTPRVREGTRIVRRVARAYGLQLVVLSERHLKNALSRDHRRTKFQIAHSMTTLFPELARYLPQPRRFYDPENRRMSAFDAVALAVTFIANQPNHKSIQQLLAAAGVLSPAPR